MPFSSLYIEGYFLPLGGKTDEGNVNSVSPLSYEAPCHAPSLLSATTSAPALGYSEYQLRYLYRGIAVVFLGMSKIGAVCPFAPL